MRKWSRRWLLFLIGTISLTATEQAEQMAVVNGSVHYKEARTAAIKLEECCGQALRHHRPPLEATMRRVAGTWLVEVGPLRSRPGMPDPLLGELARHYSHLMLVASPTAKPSEPVSTPGEQNVFGLPGRLEWWALGILALGGLLSFGGRRRYLARVGKEQNMMQEQQKLMEKQLEEDKKK